MSAPGDDDLPGSGAASDAGDGVEAESFEPLAHDAWGADLAWDEQDRVLAREAVNDDGNAKRLIRRHGDDLMHVRGVGWFVWDGAKWADDDAAGGEDGALVRCHQTGRSIHAEAKALEAKPPAGLDPEDLEDRVGKLHKFATASGNAARIRAMLEVARPYLRVALSEIDADPLLLNVANGTLDLRNAAELTLRRPSRADRITRQAPVAYDPKADCPRFMAFIERILPDRDERAFVRRYLGYALTGLTSEQKMCVWHGRGANGKSTLLEVVARLLGQYVATTPVDSLLHSGAPRSGSEATPDLARLAGSRMVRASEPEVGSRLAEAQIKSLTAGEAIVVRKLREDFFEFTPRFKLVLSCNVQPTVKGTDDGIRRRILLVPFTVQIPPEERDPELVPKLLREGPGILNWLLEGYQDWSEIGLAAPEAVQLATNDYFETADNVGAFLRQCTETVPGAEVQARLLYDGYRHWCTSNAIDAVSNTLFGKRLRELGVVRLEGGAFRRYRDVQMARWLADQLDQLQQGLPEARGGG